MSIIVIGSDDTDCSQTLLDYRPAAGKIVIAISCQAVIFTKRQSCVIDFEGVVPYSLPHELVSAASVSIVFIRILDLHAM